MNENKDRKTSVSISSFLDMGEQPLRMELVAAASGLKRNITEAAINRPGLAFSGFFQYFAHRRIQVLGLAEYAYLSSLSEADRRKRLRDFFEKRIPCVIVARNKKVFPDSIDLAEEFTVAVLKTKMITKYFVNAATIIMENLLAPRMTVQGTMVEIMGIGVLIEGEAGMGKSETALGLIKMGHALVSDDLTALRLDSAGSVIGSPMSSTRYHMEIRGLGIIHVPSLFGVSSVREEKKLDMVATLCDLKTLENEYKNDKLKKTRVFFGVDIPQVFIHVASGRDLANVIETATLDQKLKRLGHDAEKELDEKLIELMSGGKNVSE